MAGVKCRDAANMLLSAPRACVHGRLLPRRSDNGRHVHLRDTLRINTRPVASVGVPSNSAAPCLDKSYKVILDKQDTQIEQILSWVNLLLNPFCCFEIHVCKLLTLLQNKDGSLDLRPSYQREFVWKEPKSSRLIETILLKLPVQEIWLHEQQSEDFEVIDGQQRLTTIIAFERGWFDDGTPFSLQKLEILEHLNGKTYADLVKEQSPFVKTFKRYGLCLRIVKNDTDPAGVFEVYQRINTGAENLNAQQIRRAAYRGPYIELLHKLADTHMHLLPNSATSFGKEQDRELILRFFAMHNSLQNFKPPLSRFLNTEIYQHQHMDLQKTEDYTKLFTCTFRLAVKIFGENVFRKWDGKKFTGAAVDTTLWDMIMLALVDYSGADLQRFADKLQSELCRLKIKMQNNSSSARVSAANIRARKKDFTILMDKVRGQTGHHYDQPRIFSSALKDKLFAENNTCSYCGNAILRSEDADMDHIIPFSKGGKTEDTNAQLLHKSCNQQKSNHTFDLS